MGVQGKHIYDKFRYGIYIYVLQMNISITIVLLDIDTILCEYYEQLWWNVVNRVEATWVNGTNKLRTYKLFKTDLGNERYLKLRHHHHHSG